MVGTSINGHTPIKIKYLIPKLLLELDAMWLTSVAKPELKRMVSVHDRVLPFETFAPNAFISGNAGILFRHRLLSNPKVTQVAPAYSEVTAGPQPSPS